MCQGSLKLNTTNLVEWRGLLVFCPLAQELSSSLLSWILAPQFQRPTAYQSPDLVLLSPPVSGWAHSSSAVYCAQCLESWPKTDPWAPLRCSFLPVKVRGKHPTGRFHPPCTGRKPWKSPLCHPLALTLVVLVWKEPVRLLWPALFCRRDSECRGGFSVGSVSEPCQVLEGRFPRRAFIWIC